MTLRFRKLKRIPTKIAENDFITVAGYCHKCKGDCTAVLASGGRQQANSAYVILYVRCKKCNFCNEERYCGERFKARPSAYRSGIRKTKIKSNRRVTFSL